MAEGTIRDIAARRSPVVPPVSLGNFHLLSIGIDRYVDCPPLQAAVNGAREVARVLMDQFCFAQQHVLQLLDNDATREAIIETLRDLARRLTVDDSLLIFYAGHGHLDEFGLGHWVPVEASLKKAATLISNADIKNILSRAKARHILLVSDSCFAGDFLRDAGRGSAVITDDYVRMAFAKTSRQVLTSGGLEPVGDGGAEGHSVFTWFLLRELRESRQPYLVPSDLFARIKGGVAVNARQCPLLGVMQGTLGEEHGEFVLFRGGRGDSSPAFDREPSTASEATESDRTELELVAHDGTRTFLHSPSIAYPGGLGPSTTTEGIAVRRGVEESLLRWSRLRTLRFRSRQEKNDKGTTIWRHTVEATLATAEVVQLELQDDWNMAYMGGGGAGLLFGQNDLGDVRVPFSRISVLKVLKFTRPRKN